MNKIVYQKRASFLDLLWSLVSVPQRTGTEELPVTVKVSFQFFATSVPVTKCILCTRVITFFFIIKNRLFVSALISLNIVTVVFITVFIIVIKFNIFSCLMSICAAINLTNSPD